MTEFASISIRNGELVKDHSIQIDLNRVPSNDPLAFAYGVSRGQYYAKLESQGKFDNYPPNKVNHGSPFRELAQEYLRGFLLGKMGILVKEGTRIRKGQELNYYFSGENLLKSN